MIEWLNENKFRAFPLKSNSSYISVSDVLLPNDGILDAQLITSLGAGNSFTVTISPYTGLTRTVTVSSVGTFTFTNNGEICYSRIENGLLVFSPNFATLPDTTLIYNDVEFEPAVLYPFYGKLKGVSEVLFNGLVSVTDSFQLKNGYQASSLKTDDITLTLEVGRNEGNPLTCTRTVSAPDDCSSLIYSVNGVAPENNTLRFVESNYIQIFDDPPNHRIFIGLAFNRDNICNTIPNTPI